MSVNKKYIKNLENQLLPDNNRYIDIIRIISLISPIYKFLTINYLVIGFLFLRFKQNTKLKIWHILLWPVFLPTIILNIEKKIKAQNKLNFYVQLLPIYNIFAISLYAIFLNIINKYDFYKLHEYINFLIFFIKFSIFVAYNDLFDKLDKYTQKYNFSILKKIVHELNKNIVE